jgi:KDO2-lipid IV(A) lauroyltransferase
MKDLLRHGLRYPLEAALAWIALGLFRLLPVDWASATGGALARRIGPLFKAHRVARHNLTRAMPELSAERVATILDGMWDNLGRVIGEYPHLESFRLDHPAGRVRLIRGDIIETVRDSGKPAIFISGHFANWEVISFGATGHGVPLARIYRAPNNRWTDGLIRRLRRPIGGTDLPKGAAGAKGLIRALGSGRSLAILVDQKMNDGIPVPLFGRDAMTAPAVAQLALRHGCPVIPARAVRVGGARFELIVEPPMPMPDSGDPQADIATLMAAINNRLEAWIRAHPEQWLWVHQRWPD